MTETYRERLYRNDEVSSSEKSGSSARAPIENRKIEVVGAKYKTLSIGAWAWGGNWSRTDVKAYAVLDINGTEEEMLLQSVYDYDGGTDYAWASYNFDTMFPASLIGNIKYVYVDVTSSATYVQGWKLNVTYTTATWVVE